MAATNKRGVFSLETVLERQSDNYWVKIPEVFRYVNSLGGSSPAGTDFGYFMGGSAECCPYLAPFSTVDRLDFSNDTDNMVAKAALTTAKAYMRGFSSFTHGYTAGGYAPAVSTRVTTIDRIDYASDTTAQTAKGPLATGVSSNNVGLHNTEYGYTLGGSDNSSTFTSYNQRLEFANDTTTASPKGNLTQNKNYGAGAGNQSYGYYSGGGTPSRISSVERLDYSSDTATLAPKGPLSRIVNEHDAAGNADYGYHAGGWDPSSPYSNVTDRIDYASDTATALVKAILAYPGKHGPTTTGNTSYGYWTGGYGNTTASHRLDYSSDTTQMSIKGKRTTFSQNGAGVSSRANAMPLVNTTNPVPATRTEAGTPTPVGTDYGYFAGGATPSKVSSIDRLDYNNDTPTMVVKGSLTQTNEAFEGVSNISYGYFAGGNGPGSYSPRTSVDRIDYGNDTATASPKGPLAAGLAYGGGVGNNSYGYLSNGITASGYPPLMTTTVNRIDYSSDTSTALAKGPRSFEIMNSQGCGTQSYGYFGGGSSKSTVDRVDYANDTATMSPKGPLDIAGSTFAAASNSSYGWWMGRFPNQPTVSRLDFSSDTTTASPRGSMNTGKSLAAGTGNASYGYAAGGTPGSPKTQVDRVDYSNDTGTATLKGPLSIGRYRFSAASSRADVNPTSIPNTITVDKGADGYTVAGPLGPAYGYVGGGYPSSGKTLIDRIDYNNDTATASPKGNLNTARAWPGSTGNASYGYWGGGNGPLSSVDRVDYNNDTATASPKGNLSLSKKWLTATGNSSYGYYAGGNTGSDISSVDRIDFSSDTSTAAAKGPLSANKRWPMATGNASYGYVGGGEPAPAPAYTYSTIDRIDYSNDTATASPKGNLAKSRYGGGATGNADFGYYGGGYPAPTSRIDRLDFSNDTANAVVKGPLVAVRKYLAATGSQSYGYFIGGKQPGTYSYVDRVDYSNDTPTASPKGPLSRQDSSFSAASAQANAVTGTPTFIPRIRWVDSAAEASASTAGPNTGYWGAGYSGGGTSYVSRIDFDNDTATATPKGPLTHNSWDGGMTGDSSYGRNGAGDGGPAGYLTTVDRIDYSNDTPTATPKGPLSVARRGLGATGNLSYGYFWTGYSSSIVDRIDYSNDTATASGLQPSQPGPGASGTGNTSYGYFNVGNSKSTVERIDYSNDSASPSPKGSLTSSRTYAVATGNASFGYFGGNNNPVESIVDRIDYANDTATAVTKGPLDGPRGLQGATGNASYGYWGGGDSNITMNISSVSRVDFSNDTATASPKGPLDTNAHRFTNAVGSRMNGFPQTTTPEVRAPYQPPFSVPTQLPAPAPAHGYYVSGRENGSPSPATSKIDRIDFSNDTATTVLKGNMYIGRNRHTSLANQTHGYTGGGSNPAEASPSYLSSIERMTFANDTATSVDKSTFRAAFTQAPSPGQGANAAVSIGGPAYGYWGGSNSTYVDRLDYSNDTTQAAATTNSTISSNYRAAVGNLSYGYFCGGWVNKSVVDRLDYASDSTTMSPKGNLAAAVSHNFGIGNANYGYIVAGRNTGFPSDRSDVQRIDFADDTATATPKGPLAGTTYNGAGTGDASYGYVVQAQVNAPSFGYYTTIFRIDYSNDTATAAARGTFSWPGSQMRGISGRAYGLPN